jgi:hypothetical protein
MQVLGLLITWFLVGHLLSHWMPQEAAVAIGGVAGVVAAGLIRRGLDTLDQPPRGAVKCPSCGGRGRFTVENEHNYLNWRREWEGYGVSFHYEDCRGCKGKGWYIPDR